MQEIASLRHLYHVGAPLGAEALRFGATWAGPERRWQQRTSYCESSWRSTWSGGFTPDVPPIRPDWC